jgi:hypothetical protein
MLIDLFVDLRSGYSPMTTSDGRNPLWPSPSKI